MNRLKTERAVETELMDTLNCDELCVMSTKESIADIAEEKIVQRGCSCSINK